MRMIDIAICKRPLGGMYKITDDGRVFTIKYQRFLDTVVDKYGYLKVRLVSTDGGRHRYSVHRLVLENFNPVDGMDKLQVNHIDGNKKNNALSNLEWTTPKENVLHACAHGLRHNQQGACNNASKYSEETILQVIDMLKSGEYTGKYIDEKFGFSSDYANSIRRHERWGYLTKDIVFPESSTTRAKARKAQAFGV